MKHIVVVRLCNQASLLSEGTFDAVVKCGMESLGWAGWVVEILAQKCLELVGAGRAKGILIGLFILALV
jgi:hypothetical protein